jgi:hypothetical protein
MENWISIAIGETQESLRNDARMIEKVKEIIEEIKLNKIGLENENFKLLVRHSLAIKICEHKCVKCLEGCKGNFSIVCRENKHKKCGADMKCWVNERNEIYYSCNNNHSMKNKKRFLNKMETSTEYSKFL